MRCEKVLELVAVVLMALGVVAVVGRSPSLLAIRRWWWSACGSRTGTVMVFGWPREVGDEVRVAFFIYGFRVCLSFYFLHHHSSITHPLFFY